MYAKKRKIIVKMHAKNLHCAKIASIKFTVAFTNAMREKRQI